MTPSQDGIVASIRHRLLNLSKKRNEDFQFILTQYGLERFLYRISQSEFENNFILKGALLFLVWTGHNYRPTRDLDLLGSGNSSAEHLRAVFQKICHVDVEPDGLEFYPDSVIVFNIREDQEYAGQRIKLNGRLGNARISLQIDIGFGDVVTPRAVDSEYPTLLDMPKPQLHIYPPETVIAEKLHAMINLGIQNSRMKDFFDILMISRQFDFDGNTLVAAIRATFQQRQTVIPKEIPLTLSDEFSTDSQKVVQWAAFLSKNKLDSVPAALDEVIKNIRIFLIEPLQASSLGTSFEWQWKASGAWNLKDGLK